MWWFWLVHDFLIGLAGRLSLMALPNTILAGDSITPRSGVFRYCSSALLTSSVSRLPPGPVLSLIILLADFTPISARELLSGYMAELSLCLMPHLARNSLQFSLLNGGPPSVSMTSGTPNCLKCEQSQVMTVLKSLEVGFLIFKKPENRSHNAAKSRPSWWKKSTQMSWKGWLGISAGMASSLCWDGAISLHVLHWLLFWEIAAPMLGQKNLALADAFMLLSPWWAECRQSSTSPLSSEGMNIWSSFIGTPSSVYSSSLIGQNSFRSSSTSARFSGKPSSIMAFSLTQVSSVTALSLTRSQV